MAKKEKKEQKEKEAVEEIDDPAKLVKLLIKDFNKDEEKTGKIAWNLAFDSDNPTDVKEFLSTGSTLLDYIISNRRDGGVPVGKLTEISGEEASGKSLVCAQLIAECQKRGGIAVYIDTENAANPDFLQRLGVDISKMVYLQPPACEDVAEQIEKTILMVRARNVGKLVLIIWDSVAGTPTRMELEGNYDISMNVQLEKSKVLAVMMKKLTQIWGKERICMVFTNQLKTKIGVMYGDPMTTPGGKAIPYHASVRVRLERRAAQKDEKSGEFYGVHTAAKVIKNRLGPPMRKCEFDILFSSGIDNVNSWFHKLHEAGEIEKADGWCYLTSLPSGKIEEKGAKKGLDRGMKFREKGFVDLVNSTPKIDVTDLQTGEVKEVEVNVKSHVMNLLEKVMIVKYGEAPKDFEADPESLMDNEAIQEIVQNGEAT